MSLFSGGAEGVHVAKLTCQDGVVTWYNPTGALRLELHHKLSKRFKACFVIDSSDVTIKLSKETDMKSKIETKSPLSRSNYFLNDHNLETVLTATGGRSQEVCLTQDDKLVLYLEPEVSENLAYQKVSFLYDLIPVNMADEQSSIEGKISSANMQVTDVELFVFQCQF